MQRTIIRLGILLALVCAPVTALAGVGGTLGGGFVPPTKLGSGSGSPPVAGTNIAVTGSTVSLLPKINIFSIITSKLNTGFGVQAPALAAAPTIKENWDPWTEANSGVTVAVTDRTTHVRVVTASGGSIVGSLVAGNVGDEVCLYNHGDGSGSPGTSSLKILVRKSSDVISGVPLANHIYTPNLEDIVVNYSGNVCLYYDGTEGWGTKVQSLGGGLQRVTVDELAFANPLTSTLAAGMSLAFNPTGGPFGDGFKAATFIRINANAAGSTLGGMVPFTNAAVNRAPVRCLLSIGGPLTIANSEPTEAGANRFALANGSFVMGPNEWKCFGYDTQGGGYVATAQWRLIGQAGQFSKLTLYDEQTTATQGTSVVDFAPTGWDSHTGWRFIGNGAGTALHGMVAQECGAIRKFRWFGGVTTLKHQSTTETTTANRLYLPGAVDLTTRGVGGATFAYDCGLSAWTVDGSTEGSGGGGGTITGVTAGTSLTGGGTTGTVTLNVAVPAVACAAGSHVSAITAAGAGSCTADTVGSGTVTSVATGTGLTGGPITSTGTISMALCPANQVQKMNAGGTAYTCQADADTTYTQTCGAGSHVSALTSAGASTCTADATPTSQATASLSGLVNDLAIAATTTNLVITATGAVSMTGMALANNQAVTVCNSDASAAAITLFHANTNSLATDRFEFPGGSGWTLPSGNCAVFLKDPSAQSSTGRVRIAAWGATNFPSLVTGGLTDTGGLTVSGNTGLSGTLSVGGVTTTNAITVSTGSLLDVKSDATVAGLLTTGGRVIDIGTAPTPSASCAVTSTGRNSFNWSASSTVTSCTFTFATAYANVPTCTNQSYTSKVDEYATPAVGSVIVTAIAGNLSGTSGGIICVGH